MAELIPWSDFEAEYAENFSEAQGAPAKPFRMALGALIIKEKLGISDRETVEQIRENPYLQYFLGISSYMNAAPFDASMMVYFRERIDKDLVNKINQKMVKNLREKESESETEKKRTRRNRVNKKSSKVNIRYYLCACRYNLSQRFRFIRPSKKAHRKNHRFSL